MASTTSPPQHGEIRPLSEIRVQVPLSVHYLQLDTLIDLALALVIHDPDAADLAGVGHVGAAVGLQVEPHDLDDAHLGHRPSLAAGRERPNIVGLAAAARVEG